MVNGGPQNLPFSLNHVPIFTFGLERRGFYNSPALHTPLLSWVMRVNQTASGNVEPGPLAMALR